MTDSVRPMKHHTTATRTTDCDLVLTRTFDAPARLVFEAWTRPELLMRWWVPKSCGLELRACDVDAHVGGRYRFVYAHGDGEMAFFGTYREVTSPARLVWTNEEGDAGTMITTVTFDERDGQTQVVVHEHYPSKAALDAAAGGEQGAAEAYDQLDEFLREALAR